MCSTHVCIFMVNIVVSQRRKCLKFDKLELNSNRYHAPVHVSNILECYSFGSEEKIFSVSHFRFE